LTESNARAEPSLIRVRLLYRGPYYAIRMFKSTDEVVEFVHHEDDLKDWEYI
jgi:hypothetical protein